MKIENVLAWCANAERANKNAIANTSTGGYLKDAIAIIREQYAEIQKARNEIAKLYDVMKQEGDLQ